MNYNEFRNLKKGDLYSRQNGDVAINEAINPDNPPQCVECVEIDYTDDGDTTLGNKLYLTRFDFAKAEKIGSL